MKIERNDLDCYLAREFEKDSIGKNGDEACKVTQVFCDEIRMIIEKRFWEGDPQYVSHDLGKKDAMRDEIYKELEELWDVYGRLFVYNKDIHPHKYLLNKRLPFAEAGGTLVQRKKKNYFGITCRKFQSAYTRLRK